MKKLFLLIFLVACGLGQVFSHSVQVHWCTSCDGNLRIWLEHWHGTEDPNTTTMTISININGVESTITSVPGGGLIDVASEDLPGCSSNLTYVTGCPEEENLYNDWVYYDFPLLPANTPLSFTIVSGNTVFTEDCGDMYPLTVDFSLNSILDCDGNCINDEDEDGVCDELEVSGCQDASACNYNPNATEDDGICDYSCLCVLDTVFVSVLDTIFETEYVELTDTIYIDNFITDTLIEITYQNYYIYDTIVETEYIELTDTIYIDNFITDTLIEIIYQNYYIYDTIVETEYVDVIVTEYIDCDSGLPCESGMAEIIEKSKTDGKIYNLLGQEILRREGIYIESGEIKYRF